jgi:hypothetical protein
MPALGSIYTVKNQQDTYQPLLVAAVTFKDSKTDPTELLLATHNLKVSDGGNVPTGITGFPYNGQEFETRIRNHEIAATQALSDNGIDITPTVTLEIEDTNKTIWTGYESLIGFKGATLKLYFIFWEVGTSNFSNDYKTIFVGRCDPASFKNGSLFVKAISRMNMNQSYLPVVRIQKRCPWVFPDTTGMTLVDATAIHQEAADNPSVDQWHCGYSYLASGGNARGNAAPGGGRFTKCTFTFDACLDRLGNRGLTWTSGGYAPIEKDTANRVTARYGGSRWDQPTQFKSRGFGQAKAVDGFNAINEGKYNDYIPMGWGTYWIDPVVMSIVGDANFTRMEILIGLGEFQGIRKVIVNDIDVDFLATGGPQLDDQIALHLWWSHQTTGDRSGRVNNTSIYNGQGDPYGSQKILTVEVPKQLSPSSSIPRIRVLVDGPKVRVYSDTNTFSDQFSSNPSWILMDQLVWLGWNYSDLDIQTFIDSASFFDQAIAYNTISGYVTVDGDGVTVHQVSGADFGTVSPGDAIFINGVPKSVATVFSYNQLTITSSVGGALGQVPYLSAGANMHARFKYGLGLSKRISGADLIRNTRTACRSTLVPNSTNGLLQLFCDKGLADQQPSAITGSNYNTPIASKKYDNTDGLGYVAWKFDYSSILTDTNGQSSLQVDQLSATDSPNRVSIEFYDEDNGYQQDSITVVDSQDTIRVEQQNDGVIPTAGLTSFDQSKRILATWMARRSRGNPRKDTGGTISLTFKTSFKCLHLRMGHIVLFDYTQMSTDAGLVDNASNPVNGFLARVSAIKPDANYQTATVTLQWHDDDWYVDIFEQEGFQQQIPQYHNTLLRPPFPWLPWQTQPLNNDALYAREDWQFSINQDYPTDPTAPPLSKVTVAGKLPINEFAKGVPPPLVELQGNTAPSGGSIPAGKRYYAQVCAKDTEGRITPPSNPSGPCVIDIPAGADTATAVVPIAQWPKGATGYEVFMGTQRNKLSNQTSGIVTPPSTPASITISSFKEDTWGVPDVEFNTMDIRGKQCRHAGIMGLGVASVSSSTITVQAPVPLTAGAYAPSGGNARYLILLGMAGDSNPLPIATWKVLNNTTNSFSLDTPRIDPTAVPRGDGDFGIQPNDALVLTILPTIGSDGGGSYIQDTSFTNPFAPTGLEVDAEKGNELYCILGKGNGTWYKIKSNTADKIYIEGEWTVTPDATSIFIVNNPNWEFTVQSDSIVNSKNDTAVTFTLDIPNFLDTTLFVQAFTVDGGGNVTFRPFSPWRLMFAYGKNLGTRTAAITVDNTDTVLNPGSQVVTVIATTQDVNITLPDEELSQGDRITVISDAANTHPVFVKPDVIDTPSDTIDSSAGTITLSPGEFREMVGEAS